MSKTAKIIFGAIVVILLYLVFVSGVTDDSISNFEALSDPIKLREFIRFNLYTGIWSLKKPVSLSLNSLYR